MGDGMRRIASVLISIIIPSVVILIDFFFVNSWDKNSISFNGLMIYYIGFLIMSTISIYIVSRNLNVLKWK